MKKKCPKHRPLRKTPPPNQVEKSEKDYVSPSKKVSEKKTIQFGEGTLQENIRNPNRKILSRRGEDLGWLEGENTEVRQG